MDPATAWRREGPIKTSLNTGLRHVSISVMGMGSQDLTSSYNRACHDIPVRRNLVLEICSRQFIQLLPKLLGHVFVACVCSTIRRSFPHSFDLIDEHGFLELQTTL